MKTANMARNVFCFGLGFSSLALARRLIPKNWKVSGTIRGYKNNEAINKLKLQVFNYDGTHATPEICDALDRTTHLLISIPPQSTGDVIIEQFGQKIKKCKNLQWVGYISSTGVYGDAKGGWVNETSALNPVTSLSFRRIEVESSWLEYYRDYGLPVMIFRCASIYGPGRNLLLSIKKGKARRINKKGLVFSRIHVDDLAQTLEASMVRPQPGEIYNVGDDYPSPPSETVEFACGLLNQAPPPLISYDSAKLTDTARGFYKANKKVSNEKIKKKLGVRLQYPDYRVGLNSLFDQL